MSEEQAAVRQLLTILQSIHVAVQTLMKNQERLMQEQELARKAVAEMAVLVANHGLALVELWNKSGLPPLDEIDGSSVTN